MPHVTAEKICELLREDCLSFDVPGERQERLRAAFQEMGKARLPGHMMRFDYCASLETKSSLSQGEWECRPEFCRVELDDPRAVDILFEYPRPQAPAWMRPWAQALVVDGCPVEYRAFIKGGGPGDLELLPPEAAPGVPAPRGGSEGADGETHTGGETSLPVAAHARARGA